MKESARDEHAIAGGNDIPEVKALYLKAFKASWVSRNPYQRDYVMVHGFDNDRYCCMAFCLNNLKPMKRAKFARNISNIIAQMETQGGREQGLNVCPVFVKLTVKGDEFNLWFEASRPIIDYIKAKSAASNSFGWAMLQEAIVRMETYWK